MEATKKKLQRNPDWEATYKQQLQNLINAEYAWEVPEEEIADWVKDGGVVYYIAQQMVVNPENKSTPIRVVFNSSQT